ncbi:MAG: hypothetical protein HN509_13215 [Halobacteriovoraceae bacterium]|jgi:hypothetical protein|nr:hypothetical protein [Halobacteriovoraceae bacterium]MBT5094917.1 hypothetical protein [Halobacteriovoraceae bacterium]
MSEARYVKTLGKIAKIAAKSDMKAEAALFSGLQTQPESQAEFAALLKDKIEDQSENGIYLIFYLARAVPWCYVGDIHCGMGVALLSILTLEGEEGDNF